MVESVGKKFSEARLARGLTVDEAAHATKVRPDKILALENDDYSRFASNAYAKGFLLIYSRFLNVDATDQVRLLESPQRVSVEDYQYLNNAPETTRARTASTTYRVPRDRRPPSIIPLMAFATLLVVGAFGYYVFLKTQQLDLNSPSSPVAAEATPSDAESANAPQPGAGLATSQESPERPALPSSLPSAPPQPAAPSEARPPVAAPVDSLDDIPVLRAQPAQQPAIAAAVPPVIGAPVAPATQATAAPFMPNPVAMHELVLEPVRKTWVRIRKDSPTAAPIFEDYLYPGGRPLKLRGAKFFVEVRDQDAVQIRKNGSPIAYQAPGISIQ